MKVLNLASYILISLIVGLTLYSHVAFRADVVPQNPSGAHAVFSAFHSNITVLSSLQHRPPVRPMNNNFNSKKFPENIFRSFDIDCVNQSACIRPELQVVRPFTVYLCQKLARHGSRFFYLLSDGLAKHPAVKLTRDIHSADLIFFLPASSPWHRTECANASLADRLVVLDEFDGSHAFSPRRNHEELKRDYADKIVDERNVMWYFMYFKRSYVHRKDGKFLRYPFLLKKDFFPMVYSIADSYVRPEYKKDRNLLLACTLRGDPKHQPSRLRVLEWVHEYATKHVLPKSRVVTAQVNEASRQTLISDYFETMYDAQIVVTANPAGWEGDFRLWEALASGALVFVDELSTPMPFPLVHGENVVFFSTHDKADFLTKLSFYSTHEYDRESIARRGYVHAMRYHRTVNFVDYVLRSAHVKLLEADAGGTHVGIAAGGENKSATCFQYSECGQKLVHEVKKKARLL